MDIFEKFLFSNFSQKKKKASVPVFNNYPALERHKILLQLFSCAEKFCPFKDLLR